MIRAYSLERISVVQIHSCRTYMWMICLAVKAIEDGSA